MWHIFMGFCMTEIIIYLFTFLFYFGSVVTDAKEVIYLGHLLPVQSIVR